MMPTLDETQRAAADEEHLGETVTMLQDAAGSGQHVMFPGTRESRPTPVPVEEPATPAGGYNQQHTLPAVDHTGPVGRTIIWLVDRLIALMRTAPSR